MSLLVGRGLLLKLLGFVASIALARLLVPRDFGLVAVALTIIGVGRFLADSGLGSGLIRRPEPPTRAELGALLGFQLIISTVFSTVVALVAVFTRDDGAVTAVMVLTLPLVSLRSSSLLLMQRELQFGKQVIVELAEFVVYTAVAVGLAVADYGVWSLVVAQIAKSVVGTLIANALSPMRGVLPSRHLSPIRPMLAFGARFQAVSVVHLVQELGVTAVVAVVSDLTTLGLWTFAQRLLQIPSLMFNTLSAVAFPAFARLLENGEDVKPLVVRMVSITAVVVTGVMCVMVGGSRQLIPALLGEPWEGVAVIIATSALALALSSPMELPGYGYLYAAGDTRTPLMAFVVNTIVRVPATWLLLPIVGPAGIGLAWAISRPFGQVVIGRALRRELGTSCSWLLVVPTIAGCIAAGVGWELSVRISHGAVAGVAGSAVAAVVYIAIVAAFDRHALREAVDTLQQVLNRAPRPGRFRGTPASSSGTVE